GFGRSTSSPVRGGLKSISAGKVSQKKEKIGEHEPMMCPLCFGKGDYRPAPYFIRQPCPECNQSGQLYCCEGSERHGQLTQEEMEADRTLAYLIHREVE